MATIPELLDGHVTLEVECLHRLYLNGYIGELATGGGLIGFLCGQLGKPVPSPVVLGQISERFRASVKSLVERDSIPLYQFNHKERKDDIANGFRRQRAVRDGIVFIGVAQGTVSLTLLAYTEGYNRVSMAAANRKFGHYVFMESMADALEKATVAGAVQMKAIVDGCTGWKKRQAVAPTSRWACCLRRKQNRRGSTVMPC